MIEWKDAQERILRTCHANAEREVGLLDALGRASATPLVAYAPHPPFRASTMDGFAFRHDDLASDATLQIAGTVAAGEPAPSLQHGYAVRIMTGAAMPDNADTVVPVEDTEVADERVTLRDVPHPGRYVRPVGSDTAPGDLLVPAGQTLNAGDLALYAQCGHSSVRVVRAATCAILTTGNELVPPGSPPPPHAVYNTNSMALAASAVDAGAQVLMSQHVRDDFAATLAALEAAAGSAEVIVTSGGVSMGEADHVRRVLEQQGQVHFWGVSLRPGKPFLYGSFHSVPVFCLPGNPVSTMVTFELFCRPALRALGGHRDCSRPTAYAVLSKPLVHPPGRTSFQRVWLTHGNGCLLASPAPDQGIQRPAFSMTAQGLVELSAEQSGLDAGATVPVMLLRDLPSVSYCSGLSGKQAAGG